MKTVRLTTLVGDDATFSECMRYRFTLSRNLGAGPSLLVIGLNPSTATHEKPDPTITREQGFARSWGFGKLFKVNLFGWRSTDPEGLLGADDPEGDPANMDAILELSGRCDLVLAGWGGPYAPKKLRVMVQARAAVVVAALATHGKALSCIGRTKDGHPRHPLFMPGAAQPMPWP